MKPLIHKSKLRKDKTIIEKLLCRKIAGGKDDNAFASIFRDPAKFTRLLRIKKFYINILTSSSYWRSVIFFTLHIFIQLHKDIEI